MISILGVVLFFHAGIGWCQPYEFPVPAFAISSETTKLDNFQRDTLIRDCLMIG